MKILILSCNTGEGHNSAAKAISEELERRGISVEIKDALAFASKEFSKQICQAYVNLTKISPAAFGTVYKMADKVGDAEHKSFIYTLAKLCVPALYKYLKQENPDAVIMTHLFPGEMLTSIRKHQRFDAPVYVVSTDYSLCPCFEELSVNRYFIPHEHLQYQFSRRGIREDKICVTGIPVSQRFLEHKDKKEARRRLGLSEEMRLALVMTGSMGYGDTKVLVKQILENSGTDVGVVVMGGNNTRLKTELRKRYFGDPRITVLDFTKEVPLYMDACDLLLTKPGGLSSTEAAVHGIPLIHTFPIPGCETTNVEFFVQHGMSLGANDSETAARMAVSLLNDFPAQRRMLEAQNQYLNKNAAKDLCEVVIRDVSARKAKS